MKKIIAVLLIITGLMFIAYPTAKDELVRYIVKTNINKISDIDPVEHHVTYNFSNVTNVTTKDILRASQQNLPVIGKIEVPSVHLKLPIIEGVSNSSMSAGAGTLKPNQKMGQGNYALASHHMKNPKLLFSPLDRIRIGVEIFLSDDEKIYTYEVIEKKVIKATDVQVIEDVPGKTLVTLITCNAQGTKRLLVVGKLMKKI